MKTPKTLALLGVLGMLTGTAALAQQPAPDDQAPPRQRPENQAGPGRPDPEARRKALLAKYDVNKDGKLDDAERAAIGKDVEEGKFDPRLMGGRPGGPGGRGFRGPGGPEFGLRHQELLDKYDTNKDGKLDANEREAIRNDIESGKLPRPRFGPGRGGFPPPPEGDMPPPADAPHD